MPMKKLPKLNEMIAKLTFTDCQAHLPRELVSRYAEAKKHMLDWFNLPNEIRNRRDVQGDHRV